MITFKLQIVPKAGLLFEQYMFMCAGYSSFRKWKTLITARSEDEPLPDQEQDDLIRDNVNGFVGWLLLHIGGIGTKGRRQRFYLTYLLQYYGLSRDGIDVQHSMGYGVSLDMFDKMKEDCVEAGGHMTRYLKALYNNISKTTF
jgi:hypothetical protein